MAKSQILNGNGALATKKSARKTTAGKVAISPAQASLNADKENFFNFENMRIVDGQVRVYTTTSSNSDDSMPCIPMVRRVSAKKALMHATNVTVLGTDSKYKELVEKIKKNELKQYTLPGSSLLMHKRMYLNLRQSDLADICGLSTAQINRIEHGTSRPSKKTLQALSGPLKIPYRNLLRAFGYDSSIDDNIYYYTDGTQIDTNSVVNSLYRADPELLELLDNLNTYSKPEDIKMLKLVLTAMRKEALTDQSAKNASKFDKAFGNTMEALRHFTASLLSPFIAVSD